MPFHGTSQASLSVVLFTYMIITILCKVFEFSFCFTKILPACAKSLPVADRFTEK